MVSVHRRFIHLPHTYTYIHTHSLCNPLYLRLIHRPSRKCSWRISLESRSGERERESLAYVLSAPPIMQRDMRGRKCGRKLYPLCGKVENGSNDIIILESSWSVFFYCLLLLDEGEGEVSLGR